MSMAQQTAIMQLINFILVERRQEDGSIKFHAHEDFSRFLQMEKEQIIKSHCDGFYKSAEGWNGEYGLNDISNIVEEINAEQYYNQTFNN